MSINEGETPEAIQNVRSFTDVKNDTKEFKTFACFGNYCVDIDIATACETCKYALACARETAG